MITKDTIHIHRLLLESLINAYNKTNTLKDNYKYMIERCRKELMEMEQEFINYNGPDKKDNDGK